MRDLDDKKDDDKNNLDYNFNNDPLLIENYKSEKLEVKYSTDNIASYLQNTDLDTKIISAEEEQKELQNEVIPTITKIIYSLPAFSKIVHALIFYESKGSSLLLISFFTALARCVEIFLKPVLAHLSDNATFKLGRRRPFMLLGCGFYALFLVLLFSPPNDHMSPVATSIWFGTFYVFFFIADTVCNIPYMAMGPELSPDTREREKLYLVFYIFQYVGVLFTSIAPIIIQKYLKACDCSLCDEISQINDKDNCLTKCQSYCSINSNEHSLLYMCMFVGLFFVMTIIILSSTIKEKKRVNSEEESYLIPTLFRMINNKPFMTLLLPWILDATLIQIFATMLPFFINFVINPQQYCIEQNIDVYSDVCKVQYWLGITIFSFFVVCIGSMLIWHYLIKHFGKKKSWQTYSLASIITCSLFLVCEKGSMVIMVIFSVLNAIPAGGAYLNDVFVSDVIDYDEFKTGKRSEGIYIVFSSFTPKIVGIFAQSIPLTIMSIMGFRSSDRGVVFQQSDNVIEFIRFYFIAVPVLLGLISFYLKLKYPIDSELKMLKLKTVVNLQKERIVDLKSRVDFYKVKDPIYGTEHIHIFCKNPAQVQTKIVADHFCNSHDIQLLHKGQGDEIKRRIVGLLIIWSFTFVFFFVVLFITFKYLEVKSLAMLPLLSLFAITIALFCLILNMIRLKVINKVLNGEYLLDSTYLCLFLFKLRQIDIENLAQNEGLIKECDKCASDCT